MGGMLEVLKRFLGFAGTKDVLLAGTVCYLVYAAVLPRYREWRKKSRIRCRVRLQMEGQITEVNAFFDTGNSLGCSCGLLVAVTLDAMYLENENVQKVIHAPVVAFSGEDSSAFGDCQMILHPNLIDS